MAKKKVPEDDLEVQRQIVDQNFIKAGLTPEELNEINNIVEELGIEDLEQLEKAVVDYAANKLTEEKHQKVLKVIEELKEGMEFMKETFGNLLGGLIKSIENKKASLFDDNGLTEEEKQEAAGEEEELEEEGLHHTDTQDDDHEEL